jgi:type IV pilus assembly protein PilV
MFMIKRRRAMRGHSARPMRGATLVEVLVSILLAAVGLLALVGSNVASVRYSKMSQYRGTATMLAADLAERMRANTSVAGLAAYAVGSNFAAQASLPTVSTPCSSYINNCSTTQMAAFDLATWQRIVRDQLPEGAVSVVPTPPAVAPAPTVLAADVWLAWRDPAVAAPDDNTTDARNDATECPPNFSADKSVRCIYFRINL